MNDMLPEWLLNLLKPVESGKGKGSINMYAGKRLEELDEDPQARMDVLSELEGDVPAPQPAPRPAPRQPTDWSKLEEEAENQKKRRPVR